ncbi:SAM-dependent methyltransferase [Asanoa sp. WMMD1127]|uniref:SAM-dependent methyltransferase n=1 Tax=Asanoa sp. WMMD1127 TaxID=3016107 RepID=UPI00241771A6|nr:SAM-dependent methyltransferase [Asanoa sp. WMMD1127]MDG4824706.1 SAM-dependent methyltransferase [Asanoa sp. WMMD1127]
MTTSESELAAQLRTDIPHAARIWNYWMGGTDNYPADRAAGDAVAGVYPEIRLMARHSRRFLDRAVRFLATERGIRQFLDIGTGLPTMQNTHQIAQEIAPETRIVYVDKDPLVLVHAKALLGDAGSDGRVTYLQADYYEPETILAEAAKTLDFTQPIAVMFMGVMGYEPDLAVVRSIVDTVVAATASGSYLVFWDSTDSTPTAVEGAQRLVESGGAEYHLRSRDELASVFTGLELVEPGLAQITAWHADGDTEQTDAYGAVARKP